MKRWLYILTMLCFLSHASEAQQNWLYTQHLFNLYDANTAFAGQYDEASFGLRVREQWVGFDGAPSTQRISFHMPVAKGFGAGLSAFNESIGARRYFGGHLTGAYKLTMRRSSLSFGLTGGWISATFNVNDVSAKDLDDDLLMQAGQSASSVVFRFGIIYATPRWYLGVESSNLAASEIGNAPVEFTNFQPHHTLVSAYAIPIRNEDVLKPALMVRSTQGAPVSIDLGLNYLLKNRLWFGAGYRLGAAVYLLTEWNITSTLRLGYSFDATLNKLRTAQRGGHELFLGYNMPLRKHSVPSIRYFK